MSASVRLALAALGGALLTSACAVHSAGFDEPLELPPDFDAEPAAADAAPAPDRWWEALGDPTLDALVEQALDDNFDLDVFRDRLAAARAVLVRDSAPLYPAVDYSGFAQQTRRKSNDYDPDDLLGVGLIGSYQVDLWRRNASRAQAAAFDAAVAREQLEAAAIALSAEVAATWYALVEQVGQARLLEEQIETNEKVLTVVRRRFASGVVRASDVLRQERLLESTREQSAVVRAGVEVLEHALLVLVGRSPTGRFAADAFDFPSVPARPPLGLPSDLVRRRPDVRSAFLAIAAADADVAFAVADKYPRVTIGLEAANTDDDLGDLFDDWASVVGVDVLGPLFDAGLRDAEVRRARAVKAQRIDVYAQTILVAFRQVVDALSRESSRVEQIARLERQLELAERTSERLNREYLNGDISYIDVLQALTTEQRLQRDLLEAQLRRLLDRIDLYESLAGGWGAATPPDDAGPQTTERT